MILVAGDFWSDVYTRLASKQMIYVIVGRMHFLVLSFGRLNDKLVISCVQHSTKLSKMDTFETN